MDTTRQKVTSDHLRRDVYLYVRQSTIQQVFHNTESTRRQYELRRRAVALGWPEERIIVIDTDLGQSGASAADREGFQRLVDRFQNDVAISFPLWYRWFEPQREGRGCRLNV
jgi:L,D-peptidoglycan transpeptidase YkuD (ErfK/YbiS/YcfS/YnhG family)